MKKKSTALFTIIASSIHKLSLSIAIAVCLITPSWGNVIKPEIIADPKVDDKQDEQIKLKVRVMEKKEEGKIPLLELPKGKEFEVVVDGKLIDNIYVEKPEQTTPSPAWVIFLLDYSGSMKYEDKEIDGTVKLLGATKAIREFAREAAKSKGETNIAVVPFAHPGDQKEGVCNNAYIPKEEYPGHNFPDSPKFYSPEAEELESRLQELEKVKEFGGIDKLCGATDIYTPLFRAVKFLDNPEDERFNPQPKGFLKPPPIQPRLSIILLSDGEDSVEEEEKDKRIERFKSALKGNQSITIHTLGYGKDDGSKASNKHKEELAKIARQTPNGINKFAKDADKVTESFIDFLNAGEEYNITYPEPNSERGKAHSVFVTVKSPDGSRTPSESEEYRGIVFGRKAPLLKWRLPILGLTLLAVGLGGILPFKLWGDFLKKNR